VIPQEGVEHDDQLPHDRDDRHLVRLPRLDQTVVEVLPPRSPKLNGGVERANGTWRREFRECEGLPDDLPGINAGIDGFAELCNHRRPHGALQGRTPAEYPETIAESGGPESLN